MDLLASSRVGRARVDRAPVGPRRKVKAWVRFGSTPVRVDAVAARWTPDAVGIVFTVDGKEHRCWVWMGAVEEMPAHTMPS